MTDLSCWRTASVGGTPHPRDGNYLLGIQHDTHELRVEGLIEIKLRSLRYGGVRISAVFIVIG